METRCAERTLTELKELQTGLDRLQREIEKKKTFVSLGWVYKQSETVAFDLGPERLVVITADRVGIEGWDGPQVKCVLEKQVIMPSKTENTKADEQLRSIRLIHRHGPAPQTVGRTRAEREADEKEFLAGPKAQKLTNKERELRQLVETHRGSLYQAFQGKDIDAIAIAGLNEVEGNRRIEMEISGSHETVTARELQRHASLTIYVPRCKAVALQACTTGLDVKEVRGDVLVDGGKWDCTGAGSAVVQIHDLYGSLTVVDLPINTLSLDSIHGSVRFVPPMISMFDGYSWRSPGASYVGQPEGERLMPPLPMSVLTCKNIDGDFTASLIRANLHVEAVSGRIDVRNDFGDTTLTAEKALAEKRHRLVSESGRIEARFTPVGLGTLPLQALTSFGTVWSNAPYSVVEDTGDAAWPSADGTPCCWRGMMSHFGDRFFSGRAGLFSANKAMRAIVNGEDDYPGVDILSRSGTVKILYQR